MPSSVPSPTASVNAARELTGACLSLPECPCLNVLMTSSRSASVDPIALAKENWIRHGWSDAADGMVAVTSVMRAHQILLARVENALRPYDLSFSRFELLRLLAFSKTGALPITKASDRLQDHVTSVTHAIRRLESAGLVERTPHPSDGRTTLVVLTDVGRSTVEEATETLNTTVFGDIGMDGEEIDRLTDSINSLRHHNGDF
ncbi:MarR family transcriptional regulator [Gordonia jinhuaensis]|uniref:Transcriptional regulator n=2 Tax=Gordonia jinhuaensis TaxID=1517702 RepID=A0A916TIE1_9ACTN|nr:transcriptional regulator [Gordonia jinhuaensis]